MSAKTHYSTAMGRYPFEGRTNSERLVQSMNEGAITTISQNFSELGDQVEIPEFTASEIRKLLQALFPHRRLVLSQFTFFNQIGVSRPSGKTYRRGRRCYRLQDILPIACILALKEEGIPFKNIETVPAVLQTHAEKIFKVGAGVRLSGFGSNVELCFPGEEQLAEPYLDFLSGDFGMQLFWSFDVGLLAGQLEAIAEEYQNGTLEQGAIAAA